VRSLALTLARLTDDAALRRALGTRAHAVAEQGSWRARARQLVSLVTAAPAAAALVPA
jgi:hypothetical protein